MNTLQEHPCTRELFALNYFLKAFVLDMTKTEAMKMKCSVFIQKFWIPINLSLWQLLNVYYINRILWQLDKIIISIHLIGLCFPLILILYHKISQRRRLHQNFCCMCTFSSSNNTFTELQWCFFSQSYPLID